MNARERVREAGGDELLERLLHLDARRERPAAGGRAAGGLRRGVRGGLEATLAAPSPGDALDADVILAGGGLWSILAPLLAARGIRVIVLERARAGAAHREWNASGPELEALVRVGLVTRDELAALVVARYARGTCRFAGGGVYPVTGVLDHAVDAGALLAHARLLGERRGVRYLDGHTVLEHAPGPDAVRVRALDGGHAPGPDAGRALGGVGYAPGPDAGRALGGGGHAPGPDDVRALGGGGHAPGHDAVRALDGGYAPGTDAARGAGEVTLTARLLVDARGASSPFATADLVCPTVGGVLTGLAEGDADDEIDPRVGEILATIDGVDEGRQHLWEAFPGRAGETTVYLFYYADAAEPVSLLGLYARFFEKLGSYKRGDARLLRPTFGLITGWSRLTPAPRPPDARTILVGDAAAQHSPLTYCGFGKTLRALGPCVDLIEARLAGGTCREAQGDASLHALTGALARILASRSFAGDDLNRLLDAAFGSLHALGDEAYAGLLRDEMAPADFARFLRATAARNTSVWGKVAWSLGPRATGVWGTRVARAILGGS